MNQLQSSANESGFTLIEIIISTTILALISVIIYESFNASAITINKGRRIAEVYQTIRYLQNRMSREIHSTYFIKDSPFYRFTGENDSINLVVTNFPSEAGQGKYGMSGISYFIGKEKETEYKGLIRRENRIIYTSSNEAIEEFIIAKDIVGLDFRYLKKERNKDLWLNSWDSDEEGNVPGAVEVTLILRCPGESKTDKEITFPSFIIDIPVANNNQKL